MTVTNYTNRSTAQIKAVSRSTDEVRALISEGCRIVGTLELVGSVQIDGEVQGEIVSSGELIVGETGVINANIATRRIRVFGQVYGDIIADERLEFLSGACVKGSISAPKIAIQDGVVFEGRCLMPTPEPRNREDVVIMKDELKEQPAEAGSPLENSAAASGTQETFWKREH